MSSAHLNFLPAAIFFAAFLFVFAHSVLTAVQLKYILKSLDGDGLVRYSERGSWIPGVLAGRKCGRGCGKLSGSFSLFQAAASPESGSDLERLSLFAEGQLL